LNLAVSPGHRPCRKYNTSGWNAAPPLTPPPGATPAAPAPATPAPELIIAPALIPAPDPAPDDRSPLGDRLVVLKDRSGLNSGANRGMEVEAEMGCGSVLVPTSDVVTVDTFGLKFVLPYGLWLGIR
jgi:hypothetical protein